MKWLQSKLTDKIEKDILERSKSYENFLYYYRLYGLDAYLKEMYPYYSEYEEGVLVVNIDAEQDVFNEFINQQTYSKLIQVKSYSDYVWGEIKEEFSYICFVEKDHEYHPWKIADMVLNLKTSNDSAVICYRNFKTQEGTVIKDVTSQYWGCFVDKQILGRDFLKMCVDNHINLYGDLSTILCKKEIVPKKDLNSADRVWSTVLLYHILLNSYVHFSNHVYTYKRLKKYDETEEQKCKVAYYKFLKDLDISENREEKNLLDKYKNVKRDITFFHSDSSEYYNLEPIAECAQRNGYKIRFTSDLSEKAEIGVYCQHVCAPENSKLSLVLLHDMAQRHDTWPNMWVSENWDGFDIGILPGAEWVDRWAVCASAKYARPRLGVFELGYPKSDAIFSESVLEKANEVKKNFRYDFTVLYAPSWENDNKEDDFVTNLQDLPINLLVKQVPVASTPSFQFVRDNIADMREKHEGKYENLYYIDPDESILVALSICDVVVSDESSVMTEASLYGKASIAITDWLIPDRSTKRFAIVPTDNVLKCPLAAMRENIEEMSKRGMLYQEVCEKGKAFFSNQGNCSQSIVDLIENCISGEPTPHSPIRPEYEIIDMWN